MLQSLITQIGAGAVLLVCLYALIMGTWRERFGAVMYLAAYLLSLAFGVVSTEHTTWYLLIADVLCLLGFYITCWKARHPWPKWALCLQLLCVVMELATLLPLGVSERVFLTLETAAGWGVLLAILIGTISVSQERRDGRKAALPKQGSDFDKGGFL